MNISVWYDETKHSTIFTINKGQVRRSLFVSDLSLEASEDPRALLANRLQELINAWNDEQPHHIPKWWADRIINAPFDEYEDDDATGDRSGSDDRVLSNEPKLPSNNLASQHPVDEHRVG